MSSYCACCGAMDKPLALCGRCKLVRYCSKRCQTKDYIENGHKQICLETAKQQAAIQAELAKKPDPTQRMNEAFKLWRQASRPMLSILVTHLIPRNRTDMCLMVTLDYDEKTNQFKLNTCVPVTESNLQSIKPALLPYVQKFRANWKQQAVGFKEQPTDGFLAIVTCGEILATLPLLFAPGTWESSQRISVESAKRELDLIGKKPEAPEASPPPEALLELEARFKEGILRLRALEAFPKLLVNAMQLHTTQPINMTHCLHVTVEFTPERPGEISKLNSIQVITLQEARKMCDKATTVGAHARDKLDVKSNPTLLASRANFPGNVLIPIIFTLEGNDHFLFLQSELYNHSPDMLYTVVSVEQAKQYCNEVFAQLQEEF